MGKHTGSIKNVDKIIKWVETHGWEKVRQRGSHSHFKNKDDPTKGTLTIPYNITRNILKNIEKQVGEKYAGK